jgi:hypothetical protein
MLLDVEAGDSTLHPEVSIDSGGGGRRSRGGIWRGRGR